MFQCYLHCSNLEAQILEHGTVKGLGDEEKPVSSVLGKISEETLEDIKGNVCEFTYLAFSDFRIA